MRIRLIGHACVLTECSDTSILCDPWLVSKVFNSSWTLFPEPAFREEWLERVDFLWISHEHPDHLNFPTLRMLPEAWKRRVIVLYQDRNPHAVIAALRKAGYRHFQRLPHRKVVPLTAETSVYCYHADWGDSCLGIANRGEVSLNVNDAPVAEPEGRTMREDLGHVDVLLSQFSLAGYTGDKRYAETLPVIAGYLRWRLWDLHRATGAATTIPFASFVYFSTTDNRYLNEFANRPWHAHAHLAEWNYDCSLLYPGDVLEVGTPFDSTANLEKYRRLYDRFDELPFDAPPRIELAELESAFARFAADLADKYPAKRLARVRPLRIRVPDLEATLELSVAGGRLEKVGGPDAPAHIEVMSQPLLFAFQVPFGFETMEVSSRMFVLSEDGVWQENKRLFWLYRYEIYLAPKWLLSPRNLRRVLAWAPRSGGRSRRLLAGLRRLDSLSESLAFRFGRWFARRPSLHRLGGRSRASG
jgi:hypothetical protein